MAEISADAQQALGSDPFEGLPIVQPYQAGPTLGQLPEYVTSGAKDISDRLAMREAQKYLKRAERLSPEERSQVLRNISELALTLSPQAGLAVAGAEAAQTGDPSGMIAPGVALLSGPVLAKLYKVVGPRVMNTIFGASGGMAATPTQSEASEDVQKALQTNVDVRSGKKIIPMSPEDAAKWQDSERARLEESKKAVPAVTPAARTDLSKLGGRGNYGARASARSGDQADFAREERQNRERQAKIDAIDAEIAGLPERAVRSIQAWNDSPFVKRHPWATGVALGTSAAGAAALPLALQSWLTIRANRAGGLAQAEIDAANKMMQESSKLRSNRTKTERAKQIAPLLTSAEGRLSDVGKSKLGLGGTAIAGVPEGLALGNFPLEFDLAAPAGTEAHESVTETLNTLPGQEMLGLRTLLALGGTFGGQKLGTLGQRELPRKQLTKAQQLYQQHFGDLLPLPGP